MEDDDACMQRVVALAHERDRVRPEWGDLAAWIDQRSAALRAALESRLDVALRDACRRLPWPVPTAKGPTPVRRPPPAAEDADAFCETVRRLVSLEVCDPARTRGPELRLATMDKLLHPLARRFAFHFESRRETNDLTKPEWYLTDVLNTIRDNATRLAALVQPVLDDLGLAFYDVRVEFVRGMVALVRRKLARDLPAVLASADRLLPHTVHQVLQFQEDLASVYGYASLEHGAMAVFAANETHFASWITAETDAAVARLDAILRSPRAWDKRRAASSDTMRPTESADECVELLHDVQERFKFLPDLAQRLRFLFTVQKPLAGEYLREMQYMYTHEYADVATPDAFGRFALVVNSAHYLGEALRDWGEQVFYLELKYTVDKHRALADADADAEIPVTTSASVVDDPDFLDVRGTVFDDEIEACRDLETRMVGHMVDAMATRFLRESKGLFHNHKWWTTEAGEVLSRDVSPELCRPLIELKQTLEVLEDLLVAAHFDELWESLARRIRRRLLEQLVSGVLRVSEGGAHQLAHDMGAIMRVFNGYTARPAAYFREISQACGILALSHDEMTTLKTCLAGMDSEKRLAVIYENLTDKLDVSALDRTQLRKLCECRVDA